MNINGKKILVTGASGFIGSHLCEKLFSKGHQVIALNRSGSPVFGALQTVPWCFGESVKNIKFDCEVAIHLAYDFSGKKGAKRTILGTKKLVAHLYNHGVRRQLFVTSYSAGKHASSCYGRTKAILEEILRKDKRTIIIRPGLVIGDGGIYGKIVKLISRSPLIPLPGGDNILVNTIVIERLIDEMIKICIVQNPDQVANLFDPQPITLRNLARNIALDLKKRRYFISVPISLILNLTRILELIGINFPISSDSIIGLRQNQFSTHISTLEKYNENI